MKLKSIACGVVLLVALAHLPAAALPDRRLKRLYDGKQYFDLRDALLTSGADRSTELLFYRGVVSNKFNRPQESIAQLRSYLREAGESADAGVAKECYELLAANYVKTYQYRRAAEAYRTLLTKFGNRLDAKETADAENSAKLWGALGHVPHQTVTFKGDTRIQAAPDGKGQKFPVEANGRKAFITVDTGANATLLYPPFYRAYEDEIKAKYYPQADRIAGAGGFEELTAYRLPEFALTVSGREAPLLLVKLLAESTIDKSRYFYGNIGQDVTGQFEKMTINFEAMSVVLE